MRSDADDPPPPRFAWAALHVAMRAGYADVPHSPERPGRPEEIAEHVDWEATTELRRRVERLGLGVAEAMDTAQRFAIGWGCAERLIRGTGALDLARPFVAGACADHLEGELSPTALVEGVVHQARTIRAQGGIPIVLPLADLARRRADEEEFVAVYGAILDELEGPVLLHWLGPAFAPELEGYFPGRSFDRIAALDPEKVAGVKLSLLDPARERALRAALAQRGQIVLTGDDLSFADLIEGEDDTVVAERDLRGLRVPVGAFSHALLGVLDAVARPAARALEALAEGNRALYRELLEPCQAFARHAFAPPVPRYKAALALVAWLDGAQPNAMLPNHLERSWTREETERTAELALRAGAFADPEAARARLGRWPG